MIHRQGTVMGYAYELDLPQDARTLICLPAAPQETDVLRQAAPACALLAVHPNSWNDDLSPWAGQPRLCPRRGFWRRRAGLFSRAGTDCIRNHPAGFRF